MNYPGSQFDQTTQALLCPLDYRNPEPQQRYHLVVVGAGPAGLIAAIGAAGLGAKVALVERHRMGGDCLNVGCIPSKALLEYTAHSADADFASAFSWLREVRAGIAPHDSVTRYRDAGVDIFFGGAAFNDAGQIVVDEISLNTRRVVICTGARADIPPIPGLRESEPLTNETVFDLIEQPDSIAILGAGAIGCELALVFARLGVVVHLFDLAQRVLPLEIEEASQRIGQALTSAGVHIHVGQSVSSVKRCATGYSVQANDQEFEAEQLLVALGRRPNTDALQLHNAGVATDERGYIVTDNKLRSSNKKVYAAGDCTAVLQFTHHADAQARVVVQNALFAPTASVANLVVPHCTYTKPEVASVGPSPEQLDVAGVAYDSFDLEFNELDRERAELNGGGFARIYTKKGSDKILAATIVGHDAGEQIAAICLLMSNNLGLRAAGRALYCYPTRSEYLKRLADAYNRTRFTPRVASLFRRWLSATG